MSKPVPVCQGVGIDVSKDQLQVCIVNLEADQRRRIRASRKFDNTPAGWKQLSPWIDKHRVAEVPLRGLLEATGVYHEGVLYHLHRQGMPVSVVLPSQAKGYAKSLNTRSKTDAIDAQVLAQFAAERPLSAWRPPSTTLQQLKRLSRERVDLQEQRTIALNQAHAREHSYAPHARSRQRGQTLVRLLEKQIDQIEAEMQKILAADADLQRKVEQIGQVKGLGWLTVTTILAETDGFALFHHKGQVVRFAGYDVVVTESGTSVNAKTHISRKGSKHIRRALHFPALVVVKHEPLFRDLFNRVFARTAIKMKAYVAVQRKLLVLIYTLFKNDSAFDPQYATKQPTQVKKNRQELLPA